MFPHAAADFRPIVELIKVFVADQAGVTDSYTSLTRTESRRNGQMVDLLEPNFEHAVLPRSVASAKCWCVVFSELMARPRMGWKSPVRAIDWRGASPHRDRACRLTRSAAGHLPDRLR